MFRIAVLLVLGLCIVLSAAQAAPPARSAILFIGDGVDDHQLTLGRNYLHGAAGTLVFEGLEQRATARVLTIQESDPTLPEYVGDSASGGTAMSAGVVTSRGRVATTAGSDEDVVTIAELAKAAGKKVGIVATSSLTDATPASFYAHVSLRFCEGPEDMSGTRGRLRQGARCPQDDTANGGLGSIAEQLARSRVDVALGGGLETFLQRTHGGATVLEIAEKAGFRVVRSGEALAGVNRGRVLGLFGDGTLPVIWQGEGGASAERLQSVGGGAPPPVPRFGCEPSPSFGETPTLEEMTRKAIELLSAEDDSFFLMVESASIDKQAHAANPCGQIGEIRQLEEAVQVALDFAEDHPDTLIVVGSDHGQAGQVIPYPSLFAALGRRTGSAVHSPGQFAVLETPEGGTMGVSYATSTAFAEEHTGTAIPVFGQGPGSEALRGLIDQADVFAILKAALGL
ncbi:MAG: alkaline phosphatase [Acidobacteriota bacterium]|nr:alkaline phosphatase [Acidobacteriota bacterium]